jgi:hypothetical protein
MVEGQAKRLGIQAERTFLSVATREAICDAQILHLLETQAHCLRQENAHESR